MYKLFKTAILILFIFAFILSVSYADDLDPHYKFSGVKTPDSPYKNTWGAYQTDLFSGSFNYEYKIAVPPGTNGLTPKLSISYRERNKGSDLIIEFRQNRKRGITHSYVSQATDGQLSKEEMEEGFRTSRNDGDKDYKKSEGVGF